MAEQLFNLPNPSPNKAGPPQQAPMPDAKMTYVVTAQPSRGPGFPEFSYAPRKAEIKNGIGNGAANPGGLYYR